MKILFYSAKDFELPFLKSAMPLWIGAEFIRESLSIDTVTLSIGFDAVSIFTADDASATVIKKLKENNVKVIAVRAAGYDNVDINAANHAGIHIYNVPDYSPHAIAEHTVALLLALNRKLITADRQVHDQNFTVDNLVGFDLYKKKIGIIGTGKIGRNVAKIMHGFGCTVLAHDINRDPQLEIDYDVYYTGLRTICSMSDVISIHIPLTDQTRGLIEKKLIQSMKRGVILVNTARGAIVNTPDVITALDSGQIGGLAMDVYEKERGIFFNDLSGQFLNDPMMKKLMSFPNVLITPHQGFATREALKNIADGTVANLTAWQEKKITSNEITHPSSPALLPEGEGS
jgi:D-lactate dehydrogenase